MTAPMPTLRALGAAAAAACMLSSTPGVPAAADAAGAARLPRIETVLDASGSMDKADADGRSRIAAAKQSVYELLDATPAGVELGLRVYGATYAGHSKESGCRDTQQLLPIRAQSEAAKTAARDTIKGIQALGMTPIGASLTAAAHDLGSTGEREIILVSDGQDTCGPPDPCQVARELSGAGVTLHVDVIGFKVSTGTQASAARSQLQCIARATRGRYVSANDASELVDALHRSMTRTLTPYQVSGAPTRGGVDCAHAPLLHPGHWQDRLNYQQQRWYRIRIAPGQALEMSAAVIPQGMYEDSAVVRLRIYLPRKTTWWVADQSLTSNFGAAVSTGVRSSPLTRQQVPTGSSHAVVCAQVSNEVEDTSSAEPVELDVALDGQAVDFGGAPHPSPSTVSGPTAAPDAQHQTHDVSHWTARWLMGLVATGFLLALGLRALLDLRHPRRSP